MSVTEAVNKSLAAIGSTVSEQPPQQQQETSLMLDIIVPSIILFVMFAANAVIFAFIMRKRRSVVWEDRSIYQACLDPTEPATSAGTVATAAQGVAVSLEMEQLRK
ncbi:uncharacterized protein LOC118744497 isoform X2 [Rhagoletis pomonella]|uniref:uncharacterized protein LOC118744497 isoform X1 n=1 Tax=Rhagoletis pomonella TaxID=28610 RepID=UPI001783E072|nr:uncharacterized protein LOC118744497 isoform X1 [Rhagoletis pomonella]XP_036333434.1 uncharacterized protein LOC118744497 isoform X2 [Rhagoletis pomonella]